MTEEEREQYLMLAKLLAGGFGIVVLALNTHGAPVRMPGFTIHIPLLLLLALSAAAGAVGALRYRVLQLARHRNAKQAAASPVAFNAQPSTPPPGLWDRIIHDLGFSDSPQRR